MRKGGMAMIRFGYRFKPSEVDDESKLPRQLFNYMCKQASEHGRDKCSIHDIVPFWL